MWNSLRFLFSYPLPRSLSHGSFLDWNSNEIGMCSWTLWSTVEIWAWHPPLSLAPLIFLSLEFRVGDTCSTKRKSRRRRRRSESAPNATTLLCVCVLCYAPQLLEEEEVWLLPRESGSRPHDYTRDPCRSKGHAHNRDHGGFKCDNIKVFSRKRCISKSW